MKPVARQRSLLRPISIVGVHVLLLADMVFSSRLYRIIPIPIQPLLLATPVIVALLFSLLATFRAIFTATALVVLWSFLVFSQVKAFSDLNDMPLTWNASFAYMPPVTLIVFMVAASFKRMSSVYRALCIYNISYCLIFLALSLAMRLKVAPVDLSPIMATDDGRGSRLYMYASAAIFLWFHGLARLRRKPSIGSAFLFLLAVIAFGLALSRAIAAVVLFVSALYWLRMSRTTLSAATFGGFVLVSGYLCYGLADPSFNPFDRFASDASGAYRAMEFGITRKLILANPAHGLGIASSADDLAVVNSGVMIYPSDLGLVGVWLSFGIFGALLFVASTLAVCTVPRRPELDSASNDTLFLTGCAAGLYGFQAPMIWFGGGTLFALLLSTRLDAWRLASPSRTVGGRHAPTLALRLEGRAMRNLAGGWLHPNGRYFRPWRLDDWRAAIAATGRNKPSQPMARHRVRVCLYTRTWRASGSGLFTQELALGLLGAGANVTYIAPPTASAGFERPRAYLARIRPPRELGTAASRPKRALVSLGRMAGGTLALFRARRTCRVFIVSIPDPLVVSVPALFLLRLTGARIIYVAHDPVPHAWRLPAGLRRLERGLHGACYRLASRIVVLSPASRDKLLSAFPGTRAPVEVVEHGVFLLPEQTALPGTGTLLAFGTVRRNKGVMEAIEGVITARARGLGARLIVAGGPHPEDRDYFHACIRRAQEAPDAIQMMPGYLPDTALPGLLARVDALVMPYSEFFSQSGVALLAASNGRPVIATMAGGLATLLAEGMPAEAIAEPVTPAGVADAIARFLAISPDRWRARAEEYRQITLEKRSWSVIGAQYAAIARELEGERQP